MKLMAFAGVPVVALVSMLFAGPAYAGHFVYGHCAPHYYHGCAFGFGFYAPPPIYVAPPVYLAPPVVYYAPRVVVAAPAYVPAPVVVQSAPQPAPAPVPAPTFVETARRYHRHGDNRGRLDWVEGLLDGQPVRISYDDFGRVKEQEFID